MKTSLPRNLFSFHLLPDHVLRPFLLSFTVTDLHFPEDPFSLYFLGMHFRTGPPNPLQDGSTPSSYPNVTCIFETLPGFPPFSTALLDILLFSLLPRISNSRVPFTYQSQTFCFPPFHPQELTSFIVIPIEPISIVSCFAPLPVPCQIF